MPVRAAKRRVVRVLVGLLAGTAMIGLLFPSFTRASGGYHDAVIADSPVGYWRLSEASGTSITDELGAGHGGSYTGTVTLAQTGPITSDASDTAAYFSGGWGSIPYYSALNPTANQLSIEFWWKGAAPGAAQFAVLKGYTSHSDPYYQYGVGGDGSGNVRVVVDTSGSFNPWDTGVAWPGDGAWHQIVVTYDGSLGSNQLKLYIDKVQRAQTTKTGNVRGYSSALGLMDILNLGSGYNTTGRLDEVAIYNSALSSSRIAAHYDAATQTVPSNTALPRIGGTSIEGQALTTDTGAWSGGPTSYAYQWRRCDSAGANCSDISGATSSSYTLATADVGSTNRVVVTATNGAGSASATSSASVGVASSTAQLTYKQTAMADNPAGYWRLSEASGTSITDELGAGHGGTYTGSVTLGEASPITSDTADRAAYFNGGWGSLPYYSNLNPSGSQLSIEFWWKGAAPGAAQFAVLKGYTSHSDPYYQYGVGGDGSGNVRVVVDTSGSFNPWDTGVAWPGDGAWHQIVVTYDGSLGSNQLKLYIDKVQRAQTTKTGNVRGYSSALGLMDILNLGSGYNTTGRLDEVAIYNSALSSSRIAAHYDASVPPPTAPTNTSPPSISGSTVESQTLTSSTGAWTGNPTSYSYQWRRCDSTGGGCADISGAVGASYGLASADVGATIRVVVTATNLVGSGVVTSNQTAVIGPVSAPANTVPPSVSGTTTREWTLSGTNGSWTENPTTFTRQWLRCDPTGANCQEIIGATSTTYVLAEADVGSTIRLRVTATNSVGSAVATSSSTAAVAALQAVEAPSYTTELDPPPVVAYNGPYISATQWIPDGAGGYELHFRKRDTGSWDSGAYECVGFSDWPWNTCGSDSQSYDGVGGHYSFRKEIWDDFGSGSVSAGELDPVDATCGDRSLSGQPTIQCYRVFYYGGDESIPHTSSSDETEMTFPSSVPVDVAISQARAAGTKPVQIVSELPGQTDPLTLTYVVRADETDAETIANYEAALTHAEDDLIAEGEDISASYTSHPPVTAIVVSAAHAAAGDDGPDASSQSFGFMENPYKGHGAKCPSPWWPLYGRMSVHASPNYAGKRYVLQKFRWTYASLTHLQCDSTATYEADAVFYNNGSKNHYLKRTHNLVTATNLPDSYVDTNFEDNKKTPVWTLGTSDADHLRPNVDYITYMLDASGTASGERAVPSGQVGIIAGTCPHRLAAWCVIPMASCHLLNHNPRTPWEMTVPGTVSWTAPTNDACLAE